MNKHRFSSALAAVPFEFGLFFHTRGRAMKTKTSAEPPAHVAGNQPRGSFGCESHSWLAASRIRCLPSIFILLLLLPGIAHGAWSNGGFETGAANAAPPGWTVTT